MPDPTQSAPMQQTQSPQAGKLGLASGGANLDDLREKIEASVPKQFQRGYDSIMAAGLKLMFSEQTFPKMQEYVNSIQSLEDVPGKIAHGVAKVMSILMDQSKGKLPMEPAGAAAQTLMTHALDYVQKVKGMPIDNNVVAATTKATNQGIMQLLQQYSGLNPDQFQMVAQGKGKELMGDQAQQGEPTAPAAQPPAGTVA